MASNRTYSEADWRRVNPNGPINATYSVGIPHRLSDDFRYENLGLHKASASNAIATMNMTSAGTLTSFASGTFAIGTQVDFPRNLRYELNVTSDLTAAIGAGTVSIAGTDIGNNAVTETIALTDLASTGSAGQIFGTKIFQALVLSGTISGYSMAASTLSSNSVFLYIGGGQIVGVPASIQSTNAIPFAWIGTAPQPGSFTVQTGAIGTAGVSFSNALASGSPINVLRYVSN